MRFLSRFITFSLLLAGSALAQPYDSDVVTDTNDVPTAGHPKASNKIIKVRLTRPQLCDDVQYAGQPVCIGEAYRGSLALDTPLSDGMTSPVEMASLKKRGLFTKSDDLDSAYKQARKAHRNAAKANSVAGGKWNKWGAKNIKRNGEKGFTEANALTGKAKDHMQSADGFKKLTPEQKAALTPEQRQAYIKAAKDSAESAKQSAQAAAKSF